jgi:hypothetical protein
MLLRNVEVVERGEVKMNEIYSQSKAVLFSIISLATTWKNLK